MTVPAAPFLPTPMTSRWAAFPGLLVCLLAASACGGAPPADDALEVLAGPPQWRIVREEGPADDSKLALQCGSACRARFRLELPDDRSEEAGWRVLGAGQTIQIWWTVQVLPERLDPNLAHPGDGEPDRTEPHAAVVNFQYDDRPFAHHRFVVWTRPGRGSLLHLEAVPPGTYDPIPLPGSIELATVAVADLAAGRAELKRRQPRNRLVLPDEASEGDRARILRLFLDVAPLADTR